MKTLPVLRTTLRYGPVLASVACLPLVARGETNKEGSRGLKQDLRQLWLIAAMWLGLVVAGWAANLTYDNSGGTARWNYTEDNWNGANLFVDGDTVSFGGSTVAIKDSGNNNINVAPGGMKITGGDNTFSGGLITSGTFTNLSGGTTLFSGYGNSLGFSGVDLRYGLTAFSVTGPGNYGFGSGAITFDSELSGSGAARFQLTTPATVGTYELNNAMILNNIGGGSGQLIISSGSTSSSYKYNGAVTLGASLTLTMNNASTVTFTNNLTVSGSRTIHLTGTGNSAVTFSGALLGGAAGTLTLSSDNSSVRTFTLPSSGANVNIAGLTNKATSVFVSPTTATDDYFANVRANGGKIVVTGTGTGIYQGLFYLQRGTYVSSDFSTPSANGILYLDQRTSANALTLSGTFAVGGAGNSLTAVHVLMDGSSGVGTMSGNLQVGNSGTVFLDTPVYTGDTVTLAGNLRLLNGSTIVRSALGRTTRLALPAGNTLYLGDGSAATAETITLSGGVVNSGGDNEAWGFNANTISDDGNITLKYVSGVWSGSGNDKYSYDWRNSSGAVVAFRAGSAGTIFAPDPSLTVNGGFVARSTTAGFVTTSPTYLMTTGLVTISSDLHKSTPTRAPIALNSGGTFITRSNGTIRASAVTVNSGGTLGGIGTFDAPVTVASGGELAPGNSPGTVTFAQNLTLNSGAVYDWEFGATSYDTVNVSSNIILGSTVTLQIYDVGGFAEATNRYVLLTYNLVGGSDPTTNGVTWSLNFMPGGRGFQNTSQTYVYADFLNNQIILTGLQSIPEPSILFLMAVAGVCLWRKRLRKA